MRPVIDHDDFSREKIMVNDADMDFRIQGLPHSVVKHAQGTGHFLQKETEANRKFVKFSMDFCSTSRVCLQEGKISWPQTWEKDERQRIPFGQQIEEEMQDHAFRVQMIENNRD